MAKYVGVKLVEATPMDKLAFEAKQGRHISGTRQPGYAVTYPDGYTSWSPKEVFEQAYMAVSEYNRITEQNIDDFILRYDAVQWGDKTTVVHATLANGFILTESSSCVDPANFSLDIGERICREKIQNKLWELLGFLLQTAANGIKRKALVFEVGKYYQHTGGDKVRVLCEQDTTMWMETFIAETDCGELKPLGRLPENAQNWHEITEAEWLRSFEPTPR